MKASVLYYLQYGHHIDIERRQAMDEGRAISKQLEERYARMSGLDPNDPLREQLAADYLDQMGSLPLIEGYPYTEPSDLDGIRALRPEYGQRAERQNAASEVADIADRVYGAWLGRSAGCLLGHPIEGWRRERIAGLLRETDNHPIRYYISSDIDLSIAAKYGVVNEGGSYGNRCVSWINNVEHMVEDDDLNYTILGLAVAEKHGYEFSPDDVAEAWLNLLPALRTCTAERIAYRNLLNLIAPPASASYRNAYREWIGAQIRADFYGYIHPGNPEKAAEGAWRDASVSHVKNGIYGAMWVAAMLAAAAVTEKMEEIVMAGLGQIPATSRLAGELTEVLQWHADGVSYEAAVERIHGKYDEAHPYHWCHTISNAMVVAAALLYGEGDLESTIGKAVMAGFDTDCNGATAGSVIGMRNGASRLPEKWVEPLRDKIRSGVDGFGIVPISKLAERTMAIVGSNEAYRSL
ncbi:ADP-ribosylglycohydrolase family protein [Paenibacillus harenae]|uniref:ADP-ribosylglycohydrolase family protein n=1 Tax=Paenibacillus harenae TaxID=306543 RepID=UPI002794BAFF|nr:ADP-ribosylglycohydrolase family protein [Paenibacillus harenae]MDQ0059307.1 ADP-ribosylglycohydrolase [Paenibacillus harenae]